MKADSQESVEIIIRPAEGFSSGGDRQVAQIGKALPAIGTALRQPIGDLYDAMTKNVERAPEEIELQLGLAFEGGTQWAIVSFGAEATLSLTLRWKPPQRKSSGATEG